MKWRKILYLAGGLIQDFLCAELFFTNQGLIFTDREILGRTFDIVALKGSEATKRVISLEECCEKETIVGLGINQQYFFDIKFFLADWRNGSFKKSGKYNRWHTSRSGDTQ